MRHAINMMLTLDTTTLFYFSLSDAAAKDKHSGLISEWAAKVPRNAKSSNKAISGRSTSTPSLTTTGVTHSSRAPSTRSALTNNVKISTQLDDEDEVEILDNGGLSDKDETRGKEYEVAVQSPPKGKKRVTSSVS
jgi:hypothetical protein